MVDLIEAIRLGTAVVLGDGDIPGDNVHDPARTIAADQLVEALLATPSPTRRRQRLELSGAVVERPVDLRGCSVELDLLLKNCRFTESLTLAGARWSGDVELLRCLFPDEGEDPSIRAADLEITGHLVLGHVLAPRGVEVERVRIAGNFGVYGGHLGAHDGLSLDAQGAHVDRSVFVMLGQIADGGLVLSGAEVGEKLVLRNVELGVSPDGVSIDGDHLRVGQHLLADDGLETAGTVLLRHAQVHGGVHLGNARLGAPTFGDHVGESLDATDLRASAIRLGTGLETAGAVVLVRATTDRLSLHDTTLGTGSADGLYSGVSLHADQLQVSGHLLARRLVAAGALRMIDARVGGQLVLTGSRLGSGGLNDFASGVSVDLSGGVFGAVLATDGFHCDGAVVLIGTAVEGDVDLRGARLGAAGEGTSFVGVGLAADRVRAGSVKGDASTSVLGSVRLVSARLAGDLAFVGSSLGEGPDVPTDGVSLDVEGAHVDGSVFLREGFRSARSVNLFRARIGGNLELADAHLGRSDDQRDCGISLMAQNAEIGGVLSATGLVTDGAIQLVGAHVVGLANLSGSDVGVAGSESPAAGLGLFATDLRADQGLTLADAACAGAVELSHASVTQNLNLRDADIGRAAADTPYAGLSLRAERLAVDGNFVMKGATTAGGLNLMAVHVTGQLNLSSAHIGVGPDGSASSGVSVEAQGATVEGAALLKNGFTCEGVVRLGSVSIGQGLDMIGASLDTGGHHEQGASLQGENLRVDHAFVARDGFTAPGGLGLPLATIATLSLDTNEAALPPLHNVTGWRVGDVFGVLRRDRKAAARWLSGQSASQPWHELAAAYERNGRASDGRWLRYRAAVEATRKGPLGSRLARGAYRVTTGHGYYPLISLAWIALVFVVAWGATAAWADDFTTPATPRIEATYDGVPPGRVPNRDCDPSAWDLPCLHTALEAMSVALPVSPSDQPWDPPYAFLPTVVFALLKASAWAFAALLLAGITGLLRRQ